MDYIWFHIKLSIYIVQKSNSEYIKLNNVKHFARIIHRVLLLMGLFAVHLSENLFKAKKNAQTRAFFSNPIFPNQIFRIIFFKYFFFQYVFFFEKNFSNYFLVRTNGFERMGRGSHLTIWMPTFSINFEFGCR